MALLPAYSRRVRLRKLAVLPGCAPGRVRVGACYLD